MPFCQRRNQRRGDGVQDCVAVGRDWYRCAVLILLAVLFSTYSLSSHLEFVQAEPRYSSGGRVQVPEGAQAARLVQRVYRKYPPNARAAGVEGQVVLRVIVGRSGRVKEVSLVKGDPALVESAIRAVSQWQYEPYVFNGRPVEVETRVTVRFGLPVSK